MVLWMMILAGLLAWLTTRQKRRGVRLLLTWCCVACLAYAAYVQIARPWDAWRVLWVLRGMHAWAVGVLHAVTR